MGRRRRPCRRGQPPADGGGSAPPGPPGHPPHQGDGFDRCESFPFMGKVSRSDGWGGGGALAPYGANRQRRRFRPTRPSGPPSPSRGGIRRERVLPLHGEGVAKRRMGRRRRPCSLWRQSASGGGSAPPGPPGHPPHQGEGFSSSPVRACTTESPTPRSKPLLFHVKHDRTGRKPLIRQRIRGSDRVLKGRPEGLFLSPGWYPHDGEAAPRKRTTKTVVIRSRYCAAAFSTASGNRRSKRPSAWVSSLTDRVTVPSSASSRATMRPLR